MHNQPFLVENKHMNEQPTLNDFNNKDNIFLEKRSDGMKTRTVVSLGRGKHKSSRVTHFRRLLMEEAVSP